jgi:hypothetical protein
MQTIGRCLVRRSSANWLGGTGHHIPACCAVRPPTLGEAQLLCGELLGTRLAEIVELIVGQRFAPHCPMLAAVRPGG